MQSTGYRWSEYFQGGCSKMNQNQIKINGPIITREKDWAKILRETCSNQSPILLLSGFYLLLILREPPGGAIVLLGWWSSTTSRIWFPNGDWFSRSWCQRFYSYGLCLGSMGSWVRLLFVQMGAKGLSAVTFSVPRLLPEPWSHLLTQG